MVKIPVRLLHGRNPRGAATLTSPCPFEEAKPMKMVPFALVAPLMLIGCGQQKAADSDAAALERAAEQSTPEAADVLRNAADGGANVQEAMQAAGNAQAAAEQPQKVPPQLGAKPHAPGDPVPPPKIRSREGAGGNSP
jgi:hypothetical protein